MPQNPFSDSFKAKFGIAPAQTAQYRRRGSHISMGIMFLMYRFGGLLALVYIRRTLAGEEGGTTTDQGFYRSWWHHLRSRAT